MSKNKKETDRIAKAEDVEYSKELADEDDLEARNRAAQADRRAEKKK